MGTAEGCSVEGKGDGDPDGAKLGVNEGKEDGLLEGSAVGVSEG